MNKTIKTLAVTVTLAAVFGVGTYTGAKSDWKTEVINEASSRIGKAGYNKKEEIVNSDISDQMVLALDPKIKEYEDELARLLDEYYQLKLQGIVEGEELTAIENEMAKIQQNIYDRYTKEIDALFE